MTVFSSIRGRPVAWNGAMFVWEDTGAVAVGWGGEERPCPSCGLVADIEDGKGGADPCMGVLPDVESACCGHGIGPGWIGFKNGICLDVEVRQT